MATNREISIQQPDVETYTNATPMPTALGGYATGTTFSNKTMTEMWDGVLYPYQVPAFSAFAISGQTTPLEVGASILANRTFTWATTNPSNITANSLVIKNDTTGINIKTGLANDGSEVTTHTAISKSTATTNQFSITGTNSKGAVFSRTYTVAWQWRMYYGESVSTTLAEAAIKTLRVGNLGSGFAGTYIMSAGGYKYLCYPSSMGTATTFKDGGTGLNVPMETVYIVSVTNGNGIVTNYNVHRTTNILGSTLNLIVT